MVAKAAPVPLAHCPSAYPPDGQWKIITDSNSVLYGSCVSHAGAAFQYIRRRRWSE